MVNMKVRYHGPAKTFKVGGKEYHQGDIFTLNEQQLEQMARPPAGHGIHFFEMIDEPVPTSTRSTPMREQTKEDKPSN